MGGCCFCGCDIAARVELARGLVAVVLCKACFLDVRKRALRRREQGSVMFEVERETSVRVDALAAW